MRRARHSTAAAVATLLAVVLTSGCGRGSAAGASGPAAPPPSVGTQVNMPLPDRIARLPLVDSTGRQRTLASLRGTAWMLIPGMTLCQEACPLGTASLIETARRVNAAGAGSRIRFVTVTVDPQRDSSAQLAAYKALFSPVPANWLTMTGKPADVAALWTTLGVDTEKIVDDGQGPQPRNWRTGSPLTYDVAHSEQVFFFDAQQRERFVLSGLPYLASKKTVPKTIYTFMTDKGRRELNRPGPDGWTVSQAVDVLSWLTGEQIPTTTARTTTTTPATR